MYNRSNFYDETGNAMQFKATFVSILLICSTPLTAAVSPSNPNASKKTGELLAGLYALCGVSILSGQESMFSCGAFPSRRDEYVFEKTGKYPAVYASDFGDVSTANLHDRRTVVENVLSYHRKGSIISLQYHMIQPDLPDGSGFKAMNIKGSTYKKMDEILTEGTKLNKIFKKRLKEIAKYLKKLEKKGVVILWRPYHEMNGDWFWWSYQDRFKDLWIYTWKFFTYKMQCNNLLWVFSVNYWSPGATGKELPSYYYPGDKYVDLVGCDFYLNYGHKYDKRCHDILWELGNHKPMAITECGTMPTIPSLRNEQPFWVYWCTWWGFEGTDKGNTDELYTLNYSHPEVITQNEFPDKIPDTTIRVIRSSSLGSGNITRKPSSPTLSKGTEVTLTAHADSGWVFYAWSDSTLGNKATTSFILNEHTQIQAIFKPLVETKVNLIDNGDFSRKDTGWNTLGVFENAKAGSSIKDNAYRIGILSAGTEIWHVQLTQSGIAIEKGKSYTLSFDATATETKKIFVKIGQDGGNYTAYLGDTITLSEAWSHFNLPFTMASQTDKAARVEFNVGNSMPPILIDNVVLVEGEISSKPALKGEEE